MNLCIWNTFVLYELSRCKPHFCFGRYASTPTGIGAEIVIFDRKKKRNIEGQQGVETYTEIYNKVPTYLLRPETIESFFILHHLTGDPTYREWGWEIFQAIEEHCKTEYGYGEITNVNDPHAGPKDKMESFFLGETMKYLYLLQDPDSEIDLLNKVSFRIFSNFGNECDAKGRLEYDSHCFQLL